MKLSAKQKAVLCQLVAKAWRIAGQYEGCATPEDYRHEIVARVTGKAGLTECGQQDYVPLYNYCAAIAGISPIPDRTPKDWLEKAIWLVRDALRRHELPESYAIKLMMARLGEHCPAPLDTLAMQLGEAGTMQIVYTINNRGRARNRQIEARYDLPRTVETHVSPSTVPPERLADWLEIEAPAPWNPKRTNTITQ